jgi:hypothetical protein
MNESTTTGWTVKQANNDWAVFTGLQYVAVPDIYTAEKLCDLHNATLISERDWSQHLRIQLAAEVEKVNKLQAQLAVERETSDHLTKQIAIGLKRENELRNLSEN